MASKKEVSEGPSESSSSAATSGQKARLQTGKKLRKSLPSGSLDKGNVTSLENGNNNNNNNNRNNNNFKENEDNKTSNKRDSIQVEPIEREAKLVGLESSSGHEHDHLANKQQPKILISADQRQEKLAMKNDDHEIKLESQLNEDCPSEGLLMSRTCQDHLSGLPISGCDSTTSQPPTLVGSTWKGSGLSLQRKSGALAGQESVEWTHANHVPEQKQQQQQGQLLLSVRRNSSDSLEADPEIGYRTSGELFRAALRKNEQEEAPAGNSPSHKNKNNNNNNNKNNNNNEDQHNNGNNNNNNQVKQKSLVCESKSTATTASSLQAGSRQNYRHSYCAPASDSVIPNQVSRFGCTKETSTAVAAKISSNNPNVSNQNSSTELSTQAKIINILFTRNDQQQQQHQQTDELNASTKRPLLMPSLLRQYQRRLSNFHQSSALKHSQQQNQSTKETGIVRSERANFYQSAEEKNLEAARLKAGLAAAKAAGSLATSAASAARAIMVSSSNLTSTNAKQIKSLEQEMDRQQASVTDEQQQQQQQQQLQHKLDIGGENLYSLTCEFRQKLQVFNKSTSEQQAFVSIPSQLGTPSISKQIASERKKIKHFCANYINNLNLYQVNIVDIPSIEPNNFPTNSLLEWSLFKGQSHLLTADAYLLVFDLTRPSTIQYIKTLRDKIFESREMSNVPVYVIANKADLCPTLQPSLQERRLRNVAVRHHQEMERQRLREQQQQLQRNNQQNTSSNATTTTTTTTNQPINSSSTQNNPSISIKPKWMSYKRSLSGEPTNSSRSATSTAAHQLLTAYKVHRMRLGSTGPIASLRRWAHIRKAFVEPNGIPFISHHHHHHHLRSSSSSSGGHLNAALQFERNRMHYSLIMGASSGAALGFIPTGYGSYGSSSNNWLPNRLYKRFKSFICKQMRLKNGRRRKRSTTTSGFNFQYIAAKSNRRQSMAAMVSSSMDYNPQQLRRNRRRRRKRRLKRKRQLRVSNNHQSENFKCASKTHGPLKRPFWKWIASSSKSPPKAKRSRRQLTSTSINTVEDNGSSGKSLVGSIRGKLVGKRKRKRKLNVPSGQATDLSDSGCSKSNSIKSQLCKSKRKQASDKNFRNYSNMLTSAALKTSRNETTRGKELLEDKLASDKSKNNRESSGTEKLSDSGELLKGNLQMEQVALASSSADSLQQQQTIQIRQNEQPICGAFSTQTNKQSFYNIFNRLLQTSSTTVARSRLKTTTQNIYSNSNSNKQHFSTNQITKVENTTLTSYLAEENNAENTICGSLMPRFEVNSPESIINNSTRNSLQASNGKSRDGRRKSSSTGAALWQTLSSYALSRTSRSSVSSTVAGGGEAKVLSTGSGQVLNLTKNAKEEVEQQQQSSRRGTQSNLLGEGLLLGTDQYLSVDQLRKLSLISSNSQISTLSEVMVNQADKESGERKDSLENADDREQRSQSAMDFSSKHQRRKSSAAIKNSDNSMVDTTNGKRANTCTPSGGKRIWYRGMVKRILFQHSSKPSLKGLISAMEWQKRANELAAAQERMQQATNSCSATKSDNVDATIETETCVSERKNVDCESDEKQDNVSVQVKEVAVQEEDCENEKNENYHEKSSVQVRKQSLAVVQSAPAIKITSSGSSLSLLRTSRSNSTNGTDNNGGVKNLASGVVNSPESTSLVREENNFRQSDDRRRLNRIEGQSVESSGCQFSKNELKLADEKQATVSSSLCKSRSSSFETKMITNELDERDKLRIEKEEQEEEEEDSKWKVIENHSDSVKLIGPKLEKAKTGDRRDVLNMFEENCSSRSDEDDSLNSLSGSISISMAEEEENDEEELEVDEEDEDEDDDDEERANLGGSVENLDMTLNQTGKRAYSGARISKFNRKCVAKEKVSSEKEHQKERQRKEEDRQKKKVEGANLLLGFADQPDADNLSICSSSQVRKLSADDCLIINRQRRQSLATGNHDDAWLLVGARDGPNCKSAAANHVAAPKTTLKNESISLDKKLANRIGGVAINNSSEVIDGKEAERRQSVKGSIEAAIHLLVPRGKGSRSASITLGAVNCEQRPRSQLGSSFVHAVNVHRTWRDWRQLLGKKKQQAAENDTCTNLNQPSLAKNMLALAQQTKFVTAEKETNQKARHKLIGKHSYQENNQQQIVRKGCLPVQEAPSPIVNFLSAQPSFNRLNVAQQCEAIINFDQLMRINQLTLSAAYTVLMSNTPNKLPASITASNTTGINSNHLVGVAAGNSAEASQQMYLFREEINLDGSVNKEQKKGLKKHQQHQQQQQQQLVTRLQSSGNLLLNRSVSSSGACLKPASLMLDDLGGPIGVSGVGVGIGRSTADQQASGKLLVSSNELGAKYLQENPLTTPAINGKTASSGQWKAPILSSSNLIASGSANNNNMSAHIASAAADALERQRRRAEAISLILEPRFDKKQPGAQYPLFVSHDLNPILKDLAQLVRKHWKCNYIECSAASNWNIKPIISELTRTLECNHLLKQQQQQQQDQHQPLNQGTRYGSGDDEDVSSLSSTFDEDLEDAFDDDDDSEEDSDESDFSDDDDDDYDDDDDDLDDDDLEDDASSDDCDDSGVQLDNVNKFKELSNPEESKASGIVPKMFIEVAGNNDDENRQDLITTDTQDNSKPDSAGSTIRHKLRIKSPSRSIRKVRLGPTFEKLSGSDNIPNPSSNTCVAARSTKKVQSNCSVKHLENGRHRPRQSRSNQQQQQCSII